MVPSSVKPSSASSAEDRMAASKCSGRRLGAIGWSSFLNDIRRSLGGVTYFPAGKRVEPKAGEPGKFLLVSLPNQFAKRNGTNLDIRDYEAPVREAGMALLTGNIVAS